MDIPAPSETPRMPPKQLSAFVAAHFTRREEYLNAAGGTSPHYLLDGEGIRQRAREFKAAFGTLLSDTAFFYAVKSNNCPEVSKVILEEGFGLDVSSGLELETALALGADSIVFSGPGKTLPELSLAVSNADRVTVLIDSFGELRRLNQAAAAQNRIIRAGVRLTTTPTGLWRKFGILPESLGAFLTEAELCRNVTVEGVQFHTSWNMTPQAQVDFIRHLGGILESMDLARRTRIRFMDIGGGYWPTCGEWLQAAGTPEGILSGALGNPAISPTEHYCLPAMPLPQFAEAVASAIERFIFPHAQPRICFEPGRFIAHDGMHLLLTVVDKKAADLVVTDAGTNAVGWERFETDYFPVLNLSRPALAEVPCMVLGSLCTPHDVWGYAYWGEGIEEGDVLLIPTQGAYTYSLRQHFIKPLPLVKLLRYPVASGG